MRIYRSQLPSWLLQGPKQADLERVGSRSKLVYFVTSEEFLEGHRRDVRIVRVVQVRLQAGFFLLPPILKEPFHIVNSEALLLQIWNLGPTDLKHFQVMLGK